MNMKNPLLKPLSDRVVLKRLKPEQETAGGIHLPETAQEVPQQAEVIAVGPGRRDEEGVLHKLDVKIGDRVMYGKYSGTDVQLNGEEYLIVPEADILGIVVNQHK